MAGSNPHGELPWIEGDRRQIVYDYPFSEFGNPSDIGFDAERLRQLREMARPRESEA